MQDLQERLNAPSSTRDGKPRCVAFTKPVSGPNKGKAMGTQCKRSAIDSSLFCKVHQTS